MEFFKKAKTVRLRSHHGKYLWADEDECMISQHRDSSKPNATWSVEIAEDTAHIRLKSCYGCYLTASDVPFLLGMTGKKVLQMKHVDSDSSVLWVPIRDGYSVKLRTPHGNHLRANGSIPPWRNSVTHDTPHRIATQDWILWEVQAVETFANSPSAKESVSPSFKEGVSPSFKDDLSPSFKDSPSPSFKEVSSSPKIKPDSRIIHYTVADDDGEVSEDFELQINFKGHDLGLLTETLKEEIGITEDIIVCSRNHTNNRLYPIRLQLPPNNTEMYLVVVKASSRIARSFSEAVLGSERYGSNSFTHSISLKDD